VKGLGPRIVRISPHLGERPTIVCRKGEGLVLTGGRRERYSHPLWAANGEAADARNPIGKVNFQREAVSWLDRPIQIHLSSYVPQV